MYRDNLTMSATWEAYYERARSNKVSEQAVVYVNDFTITVLH